MTVSELTEEVATLTARVAGLELIAARQGEVNMALTRHVNALFVVCQKYFGGEVKAEYDGNEPPKIRDAAG